MNNRTQQTSFVSSCLILSILFLFTAAVALAVYFVCPADKVSKVPVVEVTNVTSTKSGSDAKELTFEFKGIEQPSQSYMTAEFITDLSACHIDADSFMYARAGRSRRRLWSVE